MKNIAHKIVIMEKKLIVEKELCLSYKLTQLTNKLLYPLQGYYFHQQKAIN